jgi:hypothetical protein
LIAIGNKVRHNNALQLTRRVGAAAARPVVEARRAGEGRCWAGVEDSGNQ